MVNKLLLSILAISLIVYAVSISDLSENNDIYSVVIDGGSTGSRLFVFKSSHRDGKRTITVNKGKKVMPGISSFNSHPEDVTNYLLPAILNAVEMVPSSELSNTILYVKSTAGMRLIPETEQAMIWEQLIHGLKNNENIPFIVRDENFGVIDGYAEAYYAVLASNYIAGRIDGNLHRIDGTEMVGALDMGGSSTQLIFHTETEPNTPVKQSDFWSHSWLMYGVNKLQERVWQYLIDNSNNSKISLNIEIDGTFSSPVDSVIHAQPNSAELLLKIGDKNVIESPCTFRGHVELFEGNALVGTGDAPECQALIESVMWPANQTTCSHDSRCQLDGISHPNIAGEFYGMSVYFYGLDCIRTVGRLELTHWPKPTIAELRSVVVEFCHIPWSEAEENLYGKHKFTKDSQLHYRCLEGLYMTTLLEKAFGFNPTERKITFALEVQGMEVEWTLGYVLAELK